ncbi:SDR family NAD(P)-dependent oxidoreductase [Puniceicoccaceae bacterium K14]|nr:SDR family NAD(P)-dependent oxidoreductase [Puniceicoccaceae bacterium K14]
MKNKTVMITGANRGMGYAMAKKFGEMGAKILMVCRDHDRGEKSVNTLKSAGIDAVLCVADMESPDSIEQMHREVSQQVDVIDVLINNAGVLLEGPEASIETTELSVLERTMTINFIGPYWMCKCFVPMLKKSKSGRIINYSSGMGQLTVPRMGGVPAYSVSKTAVNGLTKMLADELKDTPVKVLAVDPGWVRTDMGTEDATFSIEEGTDTAIWLATADPTEFTNGEQYKQRQILGW